jgi:hypothetical protein
MKHPINDYLQVVHNLDTYDYVMCIHFRRLLNMIFSTCLQLMINYDSYWYN